MDNNMPIKDGFLERLMFLCPKGKSLYSWLDTMAMSRGVIDGIKKGSILSADNLALLFRIERINSTWLLTGKGKPYVVDHFTRASEIIETLQDTLTDEPETTLTEVKAGDNSIGLILSLPCTVYTGKGNKIPIQYTSYHLMTGQYSDADIHSIQKAIKQVNMPSKKAKDLFAGELSNQNVIF